MSGLSLMRRIGAVFVMVVLCVAGLNGVAAPDDVSTLEIEDVSVAHEVTVRGILALGPDATGPMRVGSDPSGDASPPKLGFDLGDAFVTPDMADKQLTLTLKVNDGLPGVDGIGPAAA